MNLITCEARAHVKMRAKGTLLSLGRSLLLRFDFLLLIGHAGLRPASYV